MGGTFVIGILRYLKTLNKLCHISVVLPFWMYISHHTLNMITSNMGKIAQKQEHHHILGLKESLQFSCLLISHNKFFFLF